MSRDEVSHDPARDHGRGPGAAGHHPDAADGSESALFDGLPPGTTARGGRTMAVIGAVCAVLALRYWVFGFVGMVLGTLAHAKSDRFGLPVAVVSGLTMIAGMVGVFVLNT